MSEFKKQTEEFMKKHPVGFAGTCREITTAIFGLPITSKTPEWKKSRVRGLADYSREELLCEYRQRNGLIR